MMISNIVKFMAVVIFAVATVATIQAAAARAEMPPLASCSIRHMTQDFENFSTFVSSKNLSGEYRVFTFEDGHFETLAMLGDKTTPMVLTTFDEAGCEKGFHRIEAHDRSRLLDVINTLVDKGRIVGIERFNVGPKA